MYCDSLMSLGCFGGGTFGAGAAAVVFAAEEESDIMSLEVELDFFEEDMTDVRELGELWKC